jgi:hypothetical protein
MLEMHKSWKEIHISKMHFINPDLNFKNEIRKIKTREIQTSKIEIHKLYFQETISMFEVDNPWKHMLSSN